MFMIYKKKKGSGKTYTISGTKASSDEFGIIPRAVTTMFQVMAQNGGTLMSSSKGSPSNRREFCIKVNFIEIYKEELRDLLDPTPKDLQIREDEAGNTCICLYLFLTFTLSFFIINCQNT